MSDSKFDDKIKKTLEGHEPEVTSNWGKMRDRIAAAAAIGAMGVDAAGSKIATQLSIGAAVVIGAATMWVAQQFIGEEEVLEDDIIVEEIVDESEGEASNESNEIAQLDGLDDDKSEEELSEEISNVVDKSKNLEELDDTSVNSTNSSTTSRTTSSVKDSNKANEDSEAESIIKTKVEEEVPITTSSETSCVGAQVSFEVEGSDISKSYLWNFGDGNFSSEPNPIHTYELPGVYDVTLSLRTPGKGNIQTRTIENLITINPQPVAKMSWSFPRIITGNKVPVELIDQTLDANDATWIVDGNILNTSNPMLENPGTYQVNLIASNQFGCQDHSSNIVIVGNRNQINAPARFSPDGDGRYDSFMPFDLTGMSEKWELVIANKDGVEVFSTSEFDKPWNGELSNGELAENSSVFYWTVLCTGFDGNQRVYTDKVVVER